MADVSITLDLQAKQFHSDLAKVQGDIGSFATKATTHGNVAGKGFVGGLTSNLAGLKGVFTGILGGLGIGLGVGAIVNKFEQVIERGSRIHDIAGKFHIDAEQLQLIGNAAEQDGVSLDRVAAAMNLLQINGAKAAQTGSPIANILDRMGISATAFVAASPAEKFFMIGEAWQKGAQGAQQYADVASLIGKRNTDVILTMGQTRAQIEEVSKAMGIFSQQTVNDLDKSGDAIKKFNNNLTIGTGNFISGFYNTEKAVNSSADSIHSWLVQARSMMGLDPAAKALGLIPKDEKPAATPLNNPAPNEDMIAQAVTGGAAGGGGFVDPATLPQDQASLAARYMAAQGIDAGNPNVNLAQAAEMQRQQEAQSVIDNSISKANAEEGPIGSAADNLESVRAAGLEAETQREISINEINSAPSLEAILEQIRDNTASIGANK